MRHGSLSLKVPAEVRMKTTTLVIVKYAISETAVPGREGEGEGEGGNESARERQYEKTPESKSPNQKCTPIIYIVQTRNGT